MKKSRLAAVATGVVLAAATQLAAAARGPDYTYADLAYVYTDGTSGNDFTGNGVGLNISFAATKMIFLKFGYQRDQFDVGGVASNVDAGTFLVGGGAHYAVMKKLDLQGSASYIDTEYTGGIPSRGDDGYLVSVGARSMLTRKLELNAFASYDSRRNIINTDNHNMIYSVGGAYKLTREFSMVASISHGDLADQYGIGVRLGF
jgi:hypothetical protein